MTSGTRSRRLNGATKGASEGVNQVLPIVYLARHGETAWTLSGQYTGLTDLPLTERGERNARRLEERLRGLSFRQGIYQPTQTCRPDVRVGRLWGRGRS